MSRTIKDLTVLLALPNEQIAQGITNALRNAGCYRIKHTVNSKETLNAMQSIGGFDVFVVADDLEPHGGIDFTRFIRLTNTGMQEADIILHLQGDVTREILISAINAGTSAVMAGNITGATVLKQIEQIILHPKQFINHETYTGPDRRRPNAPPYTGVERRKS